MKLEFPPSRPLPILAACLIATLALGVVLGRHILPTTPPSAKVEGKDSDSDQDHQEVKLDAKRIAAAGIRTIHVSLGNLSDQIIAQATVAPTPEGSGCHRRPCRWHGNRYTKAAWRSGPNR